MSSILILAGILSHLLYFQHGEHHLYALTYLLLFLLSLLISTVYNHYNHPWHIALKTTFQAHLLYLTGLYTSLLLYRFFLHPLRSFPGPRAARLSSLCSITPKHNTHTTLLSLHRQYGPIVRTGPADLSLTLPSAIPAIYGPQSRCTKGPWYDMAYPSRPLQNCRDRAEHDRRRRTWSAAFSDQRLRGYEQRIRIYQRQLISRLQTQNVPVDIRAWFNRYSFDVMGDLSFGHGFDSLVSGTDHWAITLLTSAMAQVGLSLPPWLFLALVRVPGLARDWWRFLAFCAERLDTRMGMPVDTPDISETLLRPFRGREPSAAERRDLDGDARLIVVAGSDTTAAALSAIFYELVRHPDEIRKLRDELRPYVNGEVVAARIAHLDHLNGVINEALRLYPPVPGVLQRKTPPEGIEIDGVYIPGNTTVYCPQYVMGRSSLCYERPEEFLPERWYKSPELIKDRRAFAPFTIGPYSCIGRPLALLNLRTTVAKLIMTFDIEFAPGEDGRRFLEQAEDNFVLYTGGLHLILRSCA